MKQKEGKEVGPSGAMYLRVEGSKNLAPVASFKEASEKFAKVRDEAERQGGGGASKTPRVEIVDANGKVVGVVSYNGRVWAPKDYGKTDADIKPIYDNRKSKTEPKPAEGEGEHDKAIKAYSKAKEERANIKNVSSPEYAKASKRLESTSRKLVMAIRTAR
ncbi:MAG: hypothetical protein ACOYM2_18245 [Rectinemataceae bacterium]